MFTLAPVASTAIGSVQTQVLVGPALHLARPIGRYLVPLPQPLGSELLFVTGRGGVVTAAIEMVEGKPAIRFLSCPDVDQVYRRVVELQQPILELAAASVDLLAAPQPGRCRVCGCTMTMACPCGCWWADGTETLCRQHGT